VGRVELFRIGSLGEEDISRAVIPVCEDRVRGFRNMVAEPIAHRYEFRKRLGNGVRRTLNSRNVRRDVIGGRMPLTDLLEGRRRRRVERR